MDYFDAKNRHIDVEGNGFKDGESVTTFDTREALDAFLVINGFVPAPKAEDVPADK